MNPQYCYIPNQWKWKFFRTLLTIAPLFICLAGQSQTVPAAQPINPDAEEKIVTLSPFIVSQEGDRGYNAVNSVGATRISTEIKNTPMSVVVINQQFIQDIDPLDALQAARYTSGVSGAGAPRSGQMTLRGQNTAGATYHDGIVDNTRIGGANMISMPLVDRIELIKGPAGTLYGSHNSGGVINLVSKKPSSIAQTTLKTSAGLTLSTASLELDTMGALNESFTYRMILAGEEGKHFRGDYDNERTIGLMLQYTIPGGGSALLQYSFIHPVRSTNSFPWFADKDGKISYFLPRDQPIGERDSRRDHKISKLDFTVTKPFQTGEVDWNGRLVLRYLNADSFAVLYEQADANYEFYDGANVLLGTMNTISFDDPRIQGTNKARGIRIKERSRSTQTFQNEGFLANIDFVGEFDIGRVKNKLLMYGSFETNLSKFQNFAGRYVGIDLNNPVYNDDALNHFLAPQQMSSNSINYGDLWAAGVQINSSIMDEKLIFVAGLRHDYTTRSNINKINNFRTYNDVRKGTSRKIGIVGRAAEPVALYYNYAETFRPQGFTPEGAKWPNLLSINNEVGAKINMFNDRIVVNAAYFNTITENVLIRRETGLADEFGVIANIFLAAGELKVKGWEADFTVAVNENLAILGGIGSLTSVNALGIRSRAVPQGLNYKAFAKYSFTDKFLKGVFIGYGYEKNSDRAGDSSDQFTLPGYTTSDLLLGYRRDKWSIQLNVTNVWDETYAAIAVAGSIIYPGEPRLARLSARYTW